MRRYLIVMATLLLSVMAHAQHFFNLTADEVKIDSVLPCFSYQQALGPHYADSVYEVTLPAIRLLRLRCHQLCLT